MTISCLNMQLQVLFEAKLSNPENNFNHSGGHLLISQFPDLTFFP